MYNFQNVPYIQINELCYSEKVRPQITLLINFEYIFYRGSDASGKKPFRKWYSELSEIRCLLNPETKFALFTATATKQTKLKVIGMLDIEQSETLFIEKNPERKNIRYCVEYVESDKGILDIFLSIINELKEKKEMCSRRLIYTQTRKQCATIYNAFCSELEDKIYKNCEPNPRLRLVDMFHGGTPESVKKHIVAQLTIPDSCLRVVICTIAFGMGVNCSNVNESIHFGAPKSLETYIQESGRIGRNGSTSISRILYNAMLLRGADHQMTNYIKELECRRHSLMKNFENYEQESSTGCLCCDNCAKLCTCSPLCNDWVAMKIITKQTSVEAIKKARNVSPEQKNELHTLLHEYRKKLTQNTTVSLPSIHTEFYSYHINQVLTNCQYLFTLDDIYHYIEIWRKVYALSILSILNKVFCDIMEDVVSVNLPNFDQSMDSLPDEWISIRDDSEAEDLAMWDSYMLQSVNSFEECSQDTFDDNEISIEQPAEQSSFSES